MTHAERIARLEALVGVEDASTSKSFDLSETRALLDDAEAIRADERARIIASLRRRGLGDVAWHVERTP